MAPREPYGDRRQIQLRASATSGLPVSFTLVDGQGTCSVSGAVAVVLFTGTCTIEARQGGSAEWLAAAPVEATTTIVNGPSSFVLAGPTTARLQDGVANYTIEDIAGSHEFGVTPNGSCSDNFDLSVGATRGTFSVTLDAAGTCGITVDQNGTEVWNSSDAQTVTLTIVDSPPAT